MGAESMEFSPKEGEVFHSDQVVAETGELVEVWRAEVAPEGRERRVNRTKLARLFEQWNSDWLDLGQLAYVILGSEWLFRARLGTVEDIDRELARIQARLCNPAKGVLEPDQAYLLINAVRPAIERELKEKRVLISLGTWAVRDRLARWRLFAQAERDDPAAREPSLPQVKRKSGGPVPRPGPVVAALVVEGIALEKGRPADRASDLGLLAAEALLARPEPVPTVSRPDGARDSTSRSPEMRVPNHPRGVRPCVSGLSGALDAGTPRCRAKGSGLPSSRTVAKNHARPSS
jgi:hypothetical protein